MAGRSFDFCPRRRFRSLSNGLEIGSSDENIKLTYVNSDFENNNYIVNKYNWVVDEDYDDNFEITIFNGKCFCRRTDSNEGWGMNLIIKLELLDEIDEPNMKIQIIKECPGVNHYDAHNIYNNVRVFNNRYLTIGCILIFD
jgi:hypothetical protein